MGVRIATFNLKDFFLPRSEAEREVVERKVRNVAENLLRARADVVALQEVGAPELVTRLVEREAAALGYGTPVFGTPDRRGIRNAILSRLPIQWSQVHAPKFLPFPTFVAGDPEPFPERIPLRRGIVHVRVEAPAIGELDVMTVHFKSNLGRMQLSKEGSDIDDLSPRGIVEASVRSLVLRSAEALYVRGLVDSVFALLPDHAICVVGDFNDTASSVPVRIVEGMHHEGPGRLRSCGARVAVEKRFSCYHLGNRTLIDHILLSDRLLARLQEVAIYNEQLRDHSAYTAGGLAGIPLTEDSDHALAVAEVA